MKAELEKIKSALDDTMAVIRTLEVQSDPVRVELEAAHGCLFRARRLLRERQLHAENGTRECAACGGVTTA